MSPVVGYGYGSSRFVIREIAPSAGYNAHNQLLNVLIETGLVGAGLLLLQTIVLRVDFTPREICFLACCLFWSSSKVARRTSCLRPFRLRSRCCGLSSCSGPSGGLFRQYETRRPYVGSHRSSFSDSA